MAAGGDSFLLFLEELQKASDMYIGNTGDLIYTLGLLYGAKKVFDALWTFGDAFRVYFLRLGTVANDDFPTRLGEWAVVAGATSPLGAAYAHELARRKMKLILVAKSLPKLQRIVDEISEKHGVEVIALQGDFTLGSGVFREMEEILRAYEVGILVNNVTLKYQNPMYFSELSSQELWHMVNVNVAGCTMLTRILLDGMIRRGKGAVVNICPSVYVDGPCPLLTGYSSTMAYIDHFTRSIQYECCSKGVIVQCLIPVSVAEDSSCSSLLSPAPERYVRSAVRTLGVSSHTHGYLPHAIWGILSGIVPSWLRLWAIMRYHQHCRAVTLKGRQEP